VKEKVIRGQRDHSRGKRIHLAKQEGGVRVRISGGTGENGKGSQGKKLETQRDGYMYILCGETSVEGSIGDPVGTHIKNW